MGSIANLNPQSLGEMLGREIRDSIVLIAKNVVLGNSSEGCAQILGVEEEEITALMETQDYKDVYLILAAHYNAGNIATDLNYDDIEQLALQKILKRLNTENDTSKLVQVATMANRAQRRQVVNRKETALDPARASRQVSLTLSRRIVERLQGASRETTQEISIKGGSVNPTFAQVDEFFGGINKPRLPLNYQPSGEIDTEEVSLEALMRQIRK